MKDQNKQPRPPLSSSMVEDDAMEKLKKRARDLGLIVNAGSGKAAKTAKQKGGKK